MCGIVGYIGDRQAYPILIKGLQRLEYRGYDSAGIALLHDDKLNIYKTKGKVSDLIHYTENKDIEGTIGIAHTRWATHGEPNEINAHPHYSQSKKLALIHNGIIENYSILKEGLTKHGFTFQSETDTEVLVQLIEYMKNKKQVDLSTAVQLALNQVVGAYAIAVIERNHPDVIIAARKSSPLVIGIGENEYFLASDASAIIEYTRKVVYLADEEIVTLERGKGIKIKTIANVEKTPEVQELEMTLSQLEKGGFPHFMLKEIFEQPKTLSDCMRGRVNVDENNITLSGFIDNKEKFLNAKRIIITACGTSWHAALI
ncbi:MAG TPA: isomerizing glutamine--fructose-6-phosphate transaminase, partial [Paludibacteraceae bacterium]|nr:isomerizing glutamine--fructose-6-phosphate transaminase [Paludibacteraceae bacterium]